MDSPKKPTEEQIFAGIRKQFDAKVAEADIKLAPTHEKKEYTFSSTEKRRLAQLQAIAVFAQEAIDDIINLNVLPRLEYKPNPELRVLYEINLARFVIWLPRKAKNKSE